MQIRRATPNDEPVMRALWDEFNAETTYTPYPGSEFAESLLTDQLAFLAHDDGEPVFFALLLDHLDGSSATGEQR